MQKTAHHKNGFTQLEALMGKMWAQGFISLRDASSGGPGAAADYKFQFDQRPGGGGRDHHGSQPHPDDQSRHRRAERELHGKDTTVTATVPTGATTGRKRVITTWGGTITSATTFTVTE